MQHVCNVVQPTNLCLEKLFIEDFTVRNLLGCLFKTQDVFPSHEKPDELLAEVSQ